MYATPFKYGLNSSAIKNIAKQSEIYSEQDVKDIIEDFLDEVLELTLADLRWWIKRCVPKRTGQLRHNILQHIKSSSVKGRIMRIVIRTSIDYADQVNAYTTYQVRHYNTDREHSGAYAYAYYWRKSGRIKLDDPYAVGHFFDKLLKWVQKRVLINITKMKEKYSRKTQIAYKELKVGKL